jgi:hypothetical protein
MGSGFRFQFRFGCQVLGALAVLTIVVVPTFRSAVAESAVSSTGSGSANKEKVGGGLVSYIDRSADC